MNLYRSVPLFIVFILTLLGCANNTVEVVPTPTTVQLSLPTIEATPTDEPEPEVVEPTATVTLEEATIEPDGVKNIGRIVAIDLNNQLFTVNPDGTNSRQLTSEDDEIVYLFPAWSPDAESIAVIGAGDKPATDGIYVFEDIDNASSNRIFTADDQQPIYLFWSPDSENVSFIGPRIGSTLLDLRIVRRDGSERSRYLAFGQPFYWDWNSTSDEIVFNTNRTTHSEFGYVNPNSGDISDEVASVTGFFNSPDISFDDAYLAYSGVRNGRAQIVIEERETGERVTAQHEGLTALSWSPTNNQLAFISSIGRNQLPYGELHLADPSGTDETIVNEAVLAFFWSPDGNKIAYLTITQPDQNNEARRGRLSAPSRQIDGLEYQLWVLDVDSAENQLIGTFRLGDLFVLQFIPFFDQYSRSHSLWSPDSKAVLLPIITDDGTNLYRFPVDGSAATEIAPGQVGFWSNE